MQTVNACLVPESGASPQMNILLEESKRTDIEEREDEFGLWPPSTMVGANTV